VYLVDTNVISAAAPSRPVSPALIEWMDSASLFLSAVTIAEIEDGIAKSRREGATRKSADLSAWLETVLHLYGDRVLAFDVATARIAGAISDRARGADQTRDLRTSLSPLQRNIMD
jgi:predicted nucleic acid-binding protein